MLLRKSGYLECQWYFGSCSQTTHHDANNPTLRPILCDLLLWSAPKVFDSFNMQDLTKKLRTRRLGFFLFNLLIDILLLFLLLLTILILNMYVVKKEKDFQY